MVRDAIQGWDSAKDIFKEDRRQVSCDQPGCKNGWITKNDPIGRASISSIERCPKCNPK